MSMTRILPTVATLGNVAAGVVACALVANGRPEVAAVMILAAVLLDSLDGTIARALGATSEFGMELDSLADVVSFGVAPAVLVGSLLPNAVPPVAWVMVIAYPLCAAWRLARFNTRPVETEMHGDFRGLPTTGAGAAVATAVLLYLKSPEAGPTAWVVVLPVVLGLMSVLMVSHIEYRHAGAVITKLSPGLTVVAGVLFVAGSILWEYEYLVAALMWSYALSGPLVAAKAKIAAVRHA